MPTFANNPGKRRSTRSIEFQSLNPTAIAIPPGTLRLSYVLCGGGGGGASGGDSSCCGGGGGNCGETICGDVDLAELAELIFGPFPSSELASKLESIALLTEIGAGGSRGSGLSPQGYGMSGRNGQDSKFIAKTNLPGNPTQVTIAIANGGTPGMGGNTLEGWCRDHRARTYTEFGGRGIVAIKNEARSLLGSELFTQINNYGNGGHGGDRGQPGMAGMMGYFSIAFH